MEAVDEHKRTPLHVAAAWGDAEMVLLLTKKFKANMGALNDEGQTPSDVAGTKAVRQALKAVGAKVTLDDAVTAHELVRLTLPRLEEGVRGERGDASASWGGPAAVGRTLVIAETIEEEDETMDQSTRSVRAGVGAPASPRRACCVACVWETQEATLAARGGRAGAGHTLPVPLCLRPRISGVGVLTAPRLPALALAAGARKFAARGAKRERAAEPAEQGRQEERGGDEAASSAGESKTLGAARRRAPLAKRKGQGQGRFLVADS